MGRGSTRSPYGSRPTLLHASRTTSSPGATSTHSTKRPAGSGVARSTWARRSCSPRPLSVRLLRPRLLSGGKLEATASAGSSRPPRYLWYVSVSHESYRSFCDETAPQLDFNSKAFEKFLAVHICPHDSTLQQDRAVQPSGRRAGGGIPRRIGEVARWRFFLTAALPALPEARTQNAR
jgi:hypothetical protein